jgi:hypothetical protein
MQHEGFEEFCVQTQEAVELRAGFAGQGRESVAQVSLGIAVEVPLAGEPGPPGKDGEGDDLTCGEGGFGTGLPFRRARLAKVVDRNVKCGEEGVHVNHEESAPFPSGSGGKLTLERGHLPLKSSLCNSHQAFKDVLSPMLNRPQEELGRRLLVGSAQDGAEKLMAYQAAGVQRILLWSVEDELRQLTMFQERVAPLTRT